MAGVGKQVGVAGGADKRRTVRGHRPQAAPEFGVLQAAAVGEQLAHHGFQRVAAFGFELQAVAGEFGHAAHPQPVVKAGQRDFVGFVEHRRARRFVGIAQRYGQRIAFDRIHRQPDTQLRQLRAAETAQRADIGVGAEHFAAGRHAADAVARRFDVADFALVVEHYARLFAHFRQIERKQAAVAGGIVRQIQAAGYLLQRQRRLLAQAA